MKKTIEIISSILFVLFLMVNPLYAQSQGPEGATLTGQYLEYQDPVIPSSPATIYTLARLVISLLIVLVLIYLTVFLLKSLSRRRMTSTSQKLIKVIEQTHLGSKKTLCVVRVADRLLVLGMDTNNIRLLSEIDDKSVVESTEPEKFSHHLNGLMSKFKKTS